MPPKKLQKVALGKFRGEGLEAHALAGTAYRGSSCAQNTLHELAPELKSKILMWQRGEERGEKKNKEEGLLEEKERYSVEGVAKEWFIADCGALHKIEGPLLHTRHTL